MALLNDKRVLTEGVTGIGRATVLACAREGASVISFSTAAIETRRVRTMMDEVEALAAGRARHDQVDTKPAEYGTAPIVGVGGGVLFGR